LIDVLITAPPFVNNKELFLDALKSANMNPIWIESEQVVQESKILEVIAGVDAWILGDDGCTKKILDTGANGRLKAVVKWGIGTDNIDFHSLKSNCLKFSNTPNMFGNEVADLALGFLVALSRRIIPINSAIKNGEWLKLAGQSLAGKRIGIVGYGDIGKQIARRVDVMGMYALVYEIKPESFSNEDTIRFLTWPMEIETLDFLVFACPLNQQNVKMLNRNILKTMKSGGYVINVSRGGLIDELALIDALKNNEIAGAALDVFLNEPIDQDSPFLSFDNVILSSHNASNTIEAVTRTSLTTISKVHEFITLE
jgi:D-3-phosphoglycerate dehydrogenase